MTLTVRKTAKIRPLRLMLVCLAAAGCAPVASGQWYDSERGQAGKNFVERFQYERSRRAANVPDSGVVRVKTGDTYFRLANRYKVPLRALLEANKAQPPYALNPGDRIKIPLQAFYTVQPKDTLYAISRRYKTDVATLAKMNRLQQPYGISVGQLLQVPGQRQKIAAARKVTRPPKAAKPAVPANRSARTAAKPAAPSAAAQRKRKAVKQLPQAPKRVGRFRVPVQGPVISDYGPKPGGLHNDGINIAARAGTPITAAENGVVVYAGNELRGYGNLLLIRHSGGWVTAYAHASKFAVKAGDRVKQGQKVAEVGSTGNVDRPQLHFELRKGTRAINPKSLI